MSKKPTYEEIEKRLLELEQAKNEIKNTDEEAALKALRESEDKYRNLFEKTGTATFVIEEDMTISQANSKCEEFSGYTKTEIIGKMKITDFVSPDDLERIKAYHIGRRKDNCEYPSEYEFKMVDRKGNVKNVFIQVGLIPNTKQSIASLFDVTPLKQAEEELLFKEDIIRSSSSVIATCDLEGKMTYGNPTFLKKWGFKDTKEFLGRPFHEFWKVSDKLDEIMQALLKGEGRWFGEIKAIRKDGTLFDAQVSAAAVYDRKGSPVALTSTSIDITDRKQNENRLDRERRFLNQLMETSPVAITVLDREGQIVLANAMAEETLGLKRSDIYKRRYNDPDWRITRHDGSEYPDDKLPFQIIKKTKSAVYNIEHAIEWPDGKRMLLSINAAPLFDNDGNFDGMVATLENVTEPKKAEEDLSQSEYRFRQLFENINSGVAVYEAVEDGKDFIFKDFNKSAETIEKIKRHELIGEKVTKVFPGVIDFGLLDVFQRVWKTGVPEHFPITFYKDERIKGWRKNYVYKLPSGEIVAVYDDITEIKQTEEDRGRLQAQLSNALEMAHLGPWEYDVATDTFTFNDYFYKIFRTTAEEVGGYKMKLEEYAKRFLYPDDMPRVRTETQKALETDDPNFKRRIEHRIVYPDGTIGHISVQIFIVKDAEGQTIKTYGVNQDITERKKTEEELLKSHKLESLGLLAGGIAHDFNNILAAILGNISMVRSQTSPENETFELLREAEKASKRAQTLTKQLLTFAKGGMPVKETTSIGDVIKESALFVTRGSKSRCEFLIAEDLKTVEVDVGQFSQVINNIVINANQAMPDGGIIHVQAENLLLNEDNIFNLKSGSYINISIKDEGVGIPEKYLRKIFDPYFSTKQSGSGLGLATAYSIISNHSGLITAESEMGTGTVFHIYLPASGKEVIEEVKDKVIRGEGRILIMDDEEPLRKVLKRMLERLGYETEFAKDGAEAVDIYKSSKESGAPFDAVILDLTVPGGIGGKDAIRMLLNIDPEVKAIVSSGYSDDPVLANYENYGFKGVIPKPFESTSLSQTLYRVTNL